MTDGPYPALDLNMMRLAHLLLTECNVSKTALRTGHTQPSVSLALKRLRNMIGDPLLVRSGSHLVRTDRGEALHTTLTRILEEFDRLIEQEGDFDPGRLSRPIQIIAPNCIGMFLIPTLSEVLRRAAPETQLNFLRMPERANLVQLLEGGEIDLIIGNWPKPPDTLRYAPLLECGTVCLTRPDHPFARGTDISLEAFLEADHLSPTPLSESALSPIDGSLAEIGATRRIAVSVPEYTMVPYVLARTGLVFTTGRLFAEHLASMFPLAITRAPPELGRMRFYMLWHERSHKSGLSRWLRATVRRVAADLYAPRMAAAS